MLAVQLLAPAADHELAGQAVQAVDPAGLYVFAAQLEQLVVLPKPYVPPGQVWHAVDTPSTKNCPAPQQTGVPVGVQWTVPEGHDMVHGFMIMELRLVPV